MVIYESNKPPDVTFERFLYTSIRWLKPRVTYQSTFSHCHDRALEFNGLTTTLQVRTSPWFEVCRDVMPCRWCYIHEVSKELFCLLLQGQSFWLLDPEYKGIKNMENILKGNGLCNVNTQKPNLASGKREVGYINCYENYVMVNVSLCSQQRQMLGGGLSPAILIFGARWWWVV